MNELEELLQEESIFWALRHASKKPTSCIPDDVDCYGIDELLEYIEKIKAKKKLMNETKYCMFLDIETGGFSPTRNAICEIAYLVFDADTYEVLVESTFKIKPYLRDFETQEVASYKESALAINKHTIKDLEECGLSIKSVFEIFDSVIKKYQISIFGGHNIEKFDLPFIQNIYKLYLNKEFVYDDLICTLELSRNRLNLDSHKLESVCKHFSIEAENFHTAIDDTKACFEVFKRLRLIPKK